MKNNKEPEILDIKELFNMELEEEDAIVDGLINRNELILLSATAKTGKSLFANELAISVASGIPFMGEFSVTKGDVLVIQTELSNSMLSKRIKKSVSKEVISTLTQKVSFCNERIRLDGDGVPKLIELLEKYMPILLILDPFYTMHGRNEGLAGDIAPILTKLKQIVFEFGCGCLLIHHQGKRSEGSTGRQAGHMHRGSSAFADVPDASWSLERTKEKEIFKLNIEARNHHEIGPLRIKRDERFRWDLLSYEGGQSNHVTTDSILEVLSDKRLSNKELIVEINSTLGISERKANTLIKDAVALKKLNREKDGKNVYYSLNDDCTTA